MEYKINSKIGIVRGTFQIIRPHHVDLIDQAKKIVDYLYLLIDDDNRIRDLKGKCYVPITDRVKVLNAIKGIDHTRSFSTEEDFNKEVRSIYAQWSYYNPSLFYFKGGDYAPKNLPEADFLRSMKFNICCLGYTKSEPTSSLIERIKNDKGC